MDKQKQIEEMTKILQRVYNAYGQFNAEWLAEHLAVNNIGKIPERRNTCQTLPLTSSVFGATAAGLFS